MGFSFSNSSIENLKNSINIVDVVGSVVRLKRAGSNYKGVCPFHNEKTPSFVVSEQKQIFTCFGCGATGDVIEFVKRYYNLDFSEACEKLANENGITLEKHSYNDNLDIYYKVNKMAANFFYRSFTEKPNKGYPYMKRRNISPEILKKFGIGYADEEWDSLCRFMHANNVDSKILVELGLASESKGRVYDKFRNRVIFPIINTSGKVIGFGGRAINPDDNPKYLNSPESKVFRKKNNLYGLNISRQSVGKEGSIILVEGYMDVISLFQSGVCNVAASLGTALTENQAKLIKRYTRNVVLSYDADSAGRAAALRGIEILRNEDCKVKVLHVTSGKDPDEFIKENGKKAFMELVAKAPPYAQYKLETALIGYDLNKTEDKIDYTKKAVEILRSLSPVEQDIYIKRLSKSIGIAEGALRMELSGPDQARPEKNYRREKAADEEDISADITPVERLLIKIVLTNEDYIERLSRYPDIIKSDFAVKIYSMIESEYENSGFADVNRIMDNLEGKELSEFRYIMDYVIVAGNEEQLFSECIASWKDSKLEAEEKQIITLLSMADEENNQEQIIQLTDKLIKVQRERKVTNREM